MRLIRYLSSCGTASRRKCDPIIRSGRVTVNGTAEIDPFKILSEEDSVELDGCTLVLPPHPTVIILHKPAGIITTAKDTHGRKTVLDIVSGKNQRLFPIGRLDKDTTGILLLTDDGSLAFRLTHPKFEVEKTYEAIVDRYLNYNEISSITCGVNIGNGETGGATITRQIGIDNNVKIMLRLHHGKKREIRRILNAIGLQVIHLHRSSFAGIKLGKIAVGNSRPLTEKEYDFLARSTDLRPSLNNG